jgi:hypothetical protein
VGYQSVHPVFAMNFLQGDRSHPQVSTATYTPRLMKTGTFSIDLSSYYKASSKKDRRIVDVIQESESVIIAFASFSIIYVKHTRSSRRAVLVRSVTRSTSLGSSSKSTLSCSNFHRVFHPICHVHRFLPSDNDPPNIALLLLKSSLLLTRRMPL